MKTTLSIALPIIALLATAATAGNGHDSDAVVHHIFEIADLDDDGSLSRSEYAEAQLEQFGVSFDECDANTDGATSLEEYLDLFERHHGGPSRVEL